MAPNLSFGSGIFDHLVSTGSPDPRQHPFGSGHQARVRPVIRDDRRRGRPCCPGFLSPFGHRHSLPRSSDPHWGVGPSLRSAYRPRRRARTPTGFPRSTRTRCDRGGCLLYPGGGGAHPADKKSPAGACRFTAASPYTPLGTTHQARLTHNETSTEVHAIHPSGLPLARDPWMEQESFGFPSSFAPRRYQQRTSRVGPGHRAQARSYAPGIGRTSNLRARSLRATSCRTFLLVSTLITGSPAATNSRARPCR